MVASSRFFFQLNDRRAVVGEQLARELLADRFGELLREREIRLAGFAPDHVRVRRVGEATADRLLDARLRAIEAFRRALAACRTACRWRSTSLVSRSAASASVRARMIVGTPITSAARRAAVELLDRFLRRHQHLAAHVAALLHRGQLVLEVHAAGAGADHRLHQFEGVQHAAEARFRVRDDRREVVDVVLVTLRDALRVLDLVSALERRC